MKQEESINLISIVHNLGRYIKGVIIIFISILTATYFYIQQITPIYSSHMLIGIGGSKTSNVNSLFPDNTQSTNKENLVKREIKILKSRHIISKIVDNIDLSKHIFIKGKWREKELYNDEIPFELNFKNKNPKKSLFRFTVEAVDNQTFTLVSNDYHTEKTYKYSEDIETKNYKFKINKKRFISRGIKYHIVINNNKNSLISHLLNNLSVTKDEDALLIISYEDNIPQRANDILKQLVISYKKSDLKVRQRKDIKNIAFLNKRIIKLEETLKKIGNRLKKHKLEHPELLILGSEEKIFSDTVERNHKIDMLSLKLNALKTMKERIEQGIYSISILENSNLQTTDINQLIKRLREKNEYLSLLYQQEDNLDTLLINREAFNSLIEKLQVADKELRELTLLYTEEHPEVKKIRDDIYLIKEEQKNYLQKNIYKVDSEIINLKKEIYKTINILINSIKEEYSTVKNSLQEDEVKIKKLPESTMKLEELQQTFKVNQKIYEKLLQKRSESLISKESSISDIKIIDKATLPNSPIKPKNSFIYLSGIILALILSMLYTSIRKLYNKNIFSPYDIALKDFSLIYEPKEIEKSFWKLITYMEKTFPLNQTKVMLISSNNYGENKSLSIGELSIKLSKISKRVLIIDFDVYNPNLTLALNQKEYIGLSSFLTSKHPIEEINIDDYIKPIDIDSKYKYIDILPSGPILPNGSALLFNYKVSTLIKMVSKKYDYILIDTPPIGKYPEINILLSYINIFLVVAKIGKTNKSLFNKLDDNKESDIKKIFFLT